jgi:uncharacterized protein YggU (UPF0235/DUF167 family)
MARVHVRVQPGARTNKWVGWFGDMPKLAVTARPVDGAANAMVTAEVAKLLGVRPRQVHLVGGAAARTKWVEVDGCAEAEIAAALAQALGPPPAARR